MLARKLSNYVETIPRLVVIDGLSLYLGQNLECDTDRTDSIRPEMRLH